MSRKLALIIGNNDYSSRPLTNCVNDATSLANVLRGVKNCQVELRTNIKSEDMYECIKAFTESIKCNDFVIFFFAGHGIQWGDQNFLLPCDDHKITSGSDMHRYGINAQTTVGGMAEKNPHVIVFLLDCCRSYWLPKQLSNGSRGPDQQVGGLHQMMAPQQTLIAFACAAGEVVSDQYQSSNNGLFTKYLLQHITTSDVHIETILLRVARDVVNETKNSQRPLRVSSLVSEEIYLVSTIDIKLEDGEERTNQSYDPYTAIENKRDRTVPTRKPVEYDSRYVSNRSSVVHHTLPDVLVKPSSRKTSTTLPLQEPMNAVSSVRSKSHTKEKEITTNSIMSRMSSSKIDVNYSQKQDINILLLGRTGVGKSFFINALANYLVNDTLEQAVNDDIQVVIPSSFNFTNSETFELKSIILGKEDEYERINNHGESVTQKCRSFVFSIGDQNLRVIDTPPVGDTRGFEQDVENSKDIITYVAQYEYLNAICILLEPDEARLNVAWRYCIEELLSYLPKSALKNIMFIFTNARSTFYLPGNTINLLRTCLNTLKEEHGVDIPLTRENTFLLDNESFRYLAIHHNGSQLDHKDIVCGSESWSHTVKECTRLVSYITIRPVHTIHHIVSLYAVRQILAILTMTIDKLSASNPHDKYTNDSRNEKTKIDDVYRKLCKFLQVNALSPFNENIIEYISHFIRDETMRQKGGAQNADVIRRLVARTTKYISEINLFKTTMDNEVTLGHRTDLIQSEDIFPLITTLYDLPINGCQIRQQVEQLKIDEQKAEKRDIFVRLPAKAAASQLMIQLKQILSGR